MQNNDWWYVLFIFYYVSTTILYCFLGWINFSLISAAFGSPIAILAENFEFFKEMGILKILAALNFHNEGTYMLRVYKLISRKTDSVWIQILRQKRVSVCIQILKHTPKHLVFYIKEELLLQKWLQDKTWNTKWRRSKPVWRHFVKRLANTSHGFKE